MKLQNIRKRVALLIAAGLMFSMLTGPVSAETGSTEEGTALTEAGELMAAAPAGGEVQLTEPAGGDPTEPSETEPTEPTVPTDGEPTTPPTESEPTAPPTEPTAPPTEPTAPTEPTEPTAPPTEPTAPPTEPTTLPTESELNEPSESEPTETEPTESEPAAPTIDPNNRTYDPDPIDYNVYPSTPFTSGRPAVRSLNVLTNTDDVSVSKVAVPVDGMVNTWDVTLRIEGEVQTQTNDIVLILDRSYHIAQVQGTSMPESKAAAIAFIDALIPEGGGGNTRIAIIGYSDGLEREIALTNNRSALHDFVNSLTANPTGGTYIQKALRQAAAWLDNSNADHQHVILVADGVPTYSMDFVTPEAREKGLVDQNGYVVYQYGINGVTSYTGPFKQTGHNYTYSDYFTTWRAGNGYFNYAYDADLNVSLFGLIPVEPEIVPVMQSHGNSTINEAAFAKNSGYTHWTVHLGTTQASAQLLGSVASPGKAYSSSKDNLSSTLGQIAQSIASTSVLAAARNMVVTDPLSTGFHIPDEPSIAVSQGSVTYAGGVLSWQAGDLTQPVEAGSSRRYAEMSYRVEITDDILTLAAPADGLYPVNGEATVAYSGRNGADSKAFPQPKVNPLFLTVSKTLQDSSGQTLTDAGRSFAINIKNEAEGYDRTFSLRPGQSVTATDLRLAGDYTVSESGSDYHITIEVDGTESDSFTVEAPADEPPADSGQSDISVGVTNKEKDLGQLTVRKVFNNKSLVQAAAGSIGLLAAEPLEFAFTVTGPGGYSNTFSLRAGAEKTLSDLAYGEYTVVETTPGFTTSYDPANSKVTLSVTAKHGIVTVTNRVTADRAATAYKVWSRDGPATHPDVWFRLYRSTGGAAEEAGVPDKHLPDGTLSVTWEGQPIYDEQGYPYTYSVKEFINIAEAGVPIELVPGAPANYSKTEDGLTVTNQWRTVGSANVTSVSVSKTWVGVVPGTSPEALIELYDADDPQTVTLSATLTPEHPTVTWEGLSYAKGDPAVAIDYQIRETLPAGYVQTDLAKLPATISGMARTTENNNLDWPITKPSFIVTKPTGGQPYVIWTLNRLPEAERQAFIERFHAAATQFSVNYGPFAQLSLADDIIWIEGASVHHDIYPGDDSKGLIDIAVSFDGTGAIESSSISFQSQSSWAQFIVGTYSAERFTLTNTYAAADVDVDLGGTKSLDGRDLKDREFSFTLYESNITGAEGTLVETVNNLNGSFTFTDLTFTDEGTFYYLIKEDEGTLGGVTYDLTEFLVKVEVTDDGSGQLAADVSYFVFDDMEDEWVDAEAVVFDNDYAATGSFTPLVSKELSGRTLRAGEFSFVLEKMTAAGPPATWETLQTKTNNADGMILFTAITYTLTDKGTHTYRIRELASGLGGVTDDDLVVTYEVTVSDKGDGTLNVSYSTPEDSVFNNTYSADDVEIVLRAVKELTGRPLRDQECSFQLKQGETVLQTVQNQAAGSIVFDPIRYSSAGTYTYTIDEVPGSETGVSYDPLVVTVTVTVTDNGSGRLTASARYSDDVIFNNRYTAAGKAMLMVSKELAGRDLAAGEFEFELWEGDTLLQTVANEADGGVGFAINYNEADIGRTDTYTIVEVAGTETGMIYDPLLVTVTVTVTDAGNGVLALSQDYSDDLTFNNRFVSAGLTVEKRVTESKFSAAGDTLHYSFIVTNTGNIQLIGLIVNDEMLGVTVLHIDLTGEPLLPGETYTYTFTRPYTATAADVSRGRIVNELTVVGEDEYGSRPGGAGSVTTPFEQVGGVKPTPAPGQEVPRTGENPFNWAGLGGLLIGGAVVAFLLKRRQEHRMTEGDTDG